MLSEMTSLKTLDLTSCDISNKGIIDVMHALPQSNITCLILSGNKLEPECCKVIGEKLSLSNLEALEVADCGLRKFFIVEPVIFPKETLKTRKKLRRNYCDFQFYPRSEFKIIKIGHIWMQATWL